MNPRPQGIEDVLRDRPFLRDLGSEKRDAMAAYAFLAEWETRVLRGTSRGRLLDVGFGGGYFWRAASDAGWDAYGVDIHVSGVAAAQAFWRTDKLVAGRIEEIPTLFAEAFDVVNLSETLEHLADPIAALRCLTRALRPRGLLTIDVPNIQSASGWLNRDRLMDVPAHLHYWSGETLHRALELTGFNVLAVQSGIGSLRRLTRILGPTAAGRTATHLRGLGRWGGGVHALAEWPG
jgi:SAM-dependent methyltransferase